MDSESWGAITDFAEQQHALVTAEQASSVLSRRSLYRAVDRGLLGHFRKGVFVIRGAPPDPWRPLMGACLASRASGLASHRGAAGLYGAPGFGEGTCEISTTRRIRLSGVRVHTVPEVDDRDRAVRLGIPVTSAARLVVDAATWLPEPRVAQVLDHVLRRRFCTIDGVVAAQARTPKPRLVLGRLIDERMQGLRPGDSDWEVDLVKMVIDAGLPPPVQQFEVVVNGRVFFIDAAWPDRKVGLEFLGFDVHGTMRTAFDHDAERTALLAAIGWTLVPATSRSKPGVILGTLRRLLTP